MKHLLQTLPVLPLALILALTACGESAADITHLQTYSQHRITFSYPGNWKISEDSVTSGVRQIYFDTPGDAMIVLQFQPDDQMSPLQKLVQIYSDAFAESTGTMLQITSGQRTPVKESPNHQSMTETFTVTVLGTGVPHTRHYHRISMNTRACFTILQVADEDLTKVTPGYEKIVTSLQLK